MEKLGAALTGMARGNFGFWILNGREEEEGFRIYDF
jgi:hypothetical protein